MCGKERPYKRWRVRCEGRGQLPPEQSWFHLSLSTAIGDRGPARRKSNRFCAHTIASQSASCPPESREASSAHVTAPPITCTCASRRATPHSHKPHRRKPDRRNLVVADRERIMWRAHRKHLVFYDCERQREMYTHQYPRAAPAARVSPRIDQCTCVYSQQCIFRAQVVSPCSARLGAGGLRRQRCVRGIG